MAQIVDELEIISNRVNPVHYPRPIVSTLDTWDQDTQIEFHSNPGQPGKRRGWNIPSIAVTAEPVNTIRSSAVVRFRGPQVPRRTVMLRDPSITSLTYLPVPDMAQTIKVDSNVQVNFHLNLKSNIDNDSPFFAIYRDRRKISQEYRAQGAAAGVDFSITTTFTDTNAPAGLHVYDLRWHVQNSLSQITASQNNRTFQVSNLRAQ